MPPEWLCGRASEIFAQLTATLEGSGLSSPDYQAALAMLASRLVEIETLTANVEDTGHTYRTESGLTKPNPAVAMRSEAMRHAQSLCVEFGLTPAARSKVSATVPRKKNPFAALDAM